MSIEHDPFAPIRAEIIGEGRVIKTPYGLRRLTYCDHAASGRLYKPIERFMCEVVAPAYGNTHTETSFVGAQTTAFREEARDIIRLATRCQPHDAVIFTGNGVTGAIHTLIQCLGFDHASERPVVFIGPYEHHSNELPWREAPVELVVVKDCDVDGIDLDDLNAKLRQHKGRVLFGSFSAASNVTGRLTHVQAVARLMHHYGGRVFFDYAAAGPYCDVLMDGGDDPLAYCDAAFLSMHKFVGGPGAPGVLVAKTHLFQNAVPAVPGGGTISYVSPHKHTYLTDVEHREEGGTPDILGAIKSGLAMRLKDDQGPKLLDHEKAISRELLDRLARERHLRVLGSLTAPRLATLSFVVEMPVGDRRLALHHNFVVALLNDLFGIQARGGNSCAAPYAHRLLNVSEDDESALEAVVAAGYSGCKPGWTRLSFGWYDSSETVDFVIAAVKFIADWGWAFLPDYDFNPKNGSWRHRGFEPDLLALGSPTEMAPTLPEDVRPAYLQAAFARLHTPRAQRPQPRVDPTPFESIRWFWLPGEISVTRQDAPPQGA